MHVLWTVTEALGHLSSSSLCLIFLLRAVPFPFVSFRFLSVRLLARLVLPLTL
jgi:hypothetical protein